MTTTVTGGAASICSDLVDALLERGHEVAVLDDFSAGKQDNLRPVLCNDVVVHPADDRAMEVADAVASSGPEVVFRLAASGDVRRPVVGPSFDAPTNVEGITNVLDAAHAVGAPVVNVSTGGAIHDDTDVVPTPESVEPLPETPYGQSKFRAERYVGLYGRLFELGAATVGVGNVYGLRRDPLGGRSPPRARLPRRLSCRVTQVNHQRKGTHMTTSLVTGGAGFLGSHLCDELIARGHRVICVDNLETGSLANIEHIRGPDFVNLNADIIEPYHVDEPVDFVYHLASPASPIDYLRLPLQTLKVGSHGTHHTLGLAKRHRARFLLASTSEVYGDPQVHPQPESYWGHVNPIGPRGVYDEAKRYAEALTMAYHRQQGVDTAIVRIFNTYGARMRPHDGRAIPTFLRQALTDCPITVFGDGSQTRSFCYIDDLIRGLIALAESGFHHPVNVGNPDEYTLLELAEAVIEVTGSGSEIVHEALPTDDPQVRQPDTTLAEQVLGWQPEVGLRDGLSRTIDNSGVQTLVGAGVR